MFFRLKSYALEGLQVHPVDVEVDTGRGLPSTVVVGLPGKAIMESRDRVKTALVNSSMPYPRSKVTVNLTPADLRKEGPLYDLPIAMAIMVCTEILKNQESLKNLRVVGELSLDGICRPVPGILSMAEACRREGATLICPADNLPEASLVEGLNVYPVSSLEELEKLLSGQIQSGGLKAFSEPTKSSPTTRPSTSKDFLEVVGQTAAKRALTIAAAGGHNLLMLGPPGSGKSMLAERFPGLLPPMANDEALEVTRIHSVAGALGPDSPLVQERPFRAPHHTISEPALIGGGSDARPGEISLSHRGTLFLDELPEFPRKTLEVLRQPLESGSIAIHRARRRCQYPANFNLLAAMNPCPCGYHGSSVRACRCSPIQVSRYRNKLSGPLLDRVDIHVEVSDPPPASLRRQSRNGPSTAELAKKVNHATTRQEHRYKDEPWHRNGDLRGGEVERFCPLDSEGETFLIRGLEELGLSVRAYHKVLLVARTIADIEDEDDIQLDHLSEALNYRLLDQEWSA